MFKRPLLGRSVIALALAIPAIPAVASAQAAPAGTGCPPGSWFCAETTQVPAPAAPSAPSGQGGPVVQVQAVPAQSPPVVVYQPPPPVMVYEAPRTRYYTVPPPPPPVYYYRPKYRHRSEWGLNLRLEGAAFGHSPAVQSGGSMWGGGIGLRYRPVPAFALETDLDFVGGRDYNDFLRSETATTFNGLFFLNPRSRAQVYLLAGFGWSWAHVVDDLTAGGIGGYGSSIDYDYFGGQGGIGLEFRASKHFALNFDARAFIRTRIDDNTSQPEFSSNGQTTNTSAGGLFTGGMTFYF
jgi:hypothetical protein